MSETQRHLCHVCKHEWATVIIDRGVPKCGLCLREERDRALLAMRRFAELDDERAEMWRYRESWNAELGARWDQVIPMIENAVQAFRDGDVEAAMKAMEDDR